MSEATDLAMIEFRAVSKTYPSGRQRVHALSDVSLAIPPGEFVSVMGRSGSGKSTLLNLMAGLDTPTSGSVCVSGLDLGVLSDDRLSQLRLRTIGFIFQSFNLFPSFTVLENVAWRLEFMGTPRRRARVEAAAALEEVGIGGDARDRRPAELSGGEQQRVAVARALVTRPDILLADEPTGNLDSQTGTRVLHLLRALNRERGVTIVLVTHSTLAATVGHRTVELADGRIIRDVEAPPEPRGEVIPFRD